MASSSSRSHRPYPRTARVNQILREVLSEELVRLGDVDERIGLLTVTDVSVSPDLRTATVFLDSLSEVAAEALAEQRVQLQASVNAQTRLKRTPKLSFAADPAISSGEGVEEIIRRLHHDEP